MSLSFETKGNTLDSYLDEPLPGIITPSGEIFGPEHIYKAKIMYEADRIKELSDLEIFRNAVFNILSAGERYDKQILLYRNLRLKNLDTPKAIVQNTDGVSVNLQAARFQAKKARKVCEFAEWWLSSSFGERILTDLKTGKLEEFRIRDYFAENAPGVGYKVASLIGNMCGYENVVPLDIWAMRFLSSEGKPVKVPDYISTGGPRGELYRSYEKHFSEIARECGLSPAWLQRIVWTKYSTWDNARRKSASSSNAHNSSLDFFVQS